MRHPCCYGIDIPTYKELIAAKRSEEEILAHVGCDTLGYLSPEGMLRPLEADTGASYCDACFTGNYPIPFEQLPKPKPLVQVQR